MDIRSIQQILHDEFGAGVGIVEEGRTSTWIEVDSERVPDVCRFLRDQADLEFDALVNLTGCDYPDAGKIQVIYEFYSYLNDHELVVKTDTDRERPSVPTLTDVWPAANWLEREVYDLLGIDFPGHPDLRRLLLPDDWIGHPLRKDYSEQPEYHGIPTTRPNPLDIPGRE